MNKIDDDNDFESDVAVAVVCCLSHRLPKRNMKVCMGNETWIK